MVVVKSVKVTPREDGTLESVAVITAANGDEITSGDLGLAYISAIKGVVPNEAGYVLGGAAITNPDSMNNSVTLTLYAVSGSYLTSAGSADWTITALQI